MIPPLPVDDEDDVLLMVVINHDDKTVDISWRGDLTLEQRKHVLQSVIEQTIIQ